MAAPMMNTETFEQQLLEQIRQQRWASGERLPTERVFSEQTGLSRAAVRKVLQRLKAQGLISQTVGSGTYVARTAPDNLPQGGVRGPRSIPRRTRSRSPMATPSAMAS